MSSRDVAAAIAAKLGTDINGVVPTIKKFVRERDEALKRG